MKERLDANSIKALVAYRLERAHETVKEAELLFDAAHYNATINRLYYACFYAVSALLLKSKIHAHTHNGTKTMFGLHFVSCGKISIKTAITYFTLFEKRQSGDYDDFIYFDKHSTAELLKQTKTFLIELEKLIKKKEK